jgi:hypothetical protein
MATYRKDRQRYLNPADTMFEVVMLADKYGNLVGGANPSGMAVDAFGRARVAQPFTMYDSFHRYQDNGKITSEVSGGGTMGYDENTSSILMGVGTALGDSAKRETSRVFAYQPGKSLQILLSYVMNEPKANLRQRVGYFSTENGIFLEVLHNVTYLVKRTKISGSVVEVRIPQHEWNMDVMDGSGISEVILDVSKGQIFFIDIEWLGVGSVRCGFVVNGIFYHVHTFHHANSTASAYMTTAQLPGRVEIENVGVTDSPSVYKQICFSVISEGGYEIRGRNFSKGTPVATPKVIPLGVQIPAISIRLKSNRLDAIVVPKALSILGVGNSTRLQYKIIAGATLTSPVWVSADTDSSVEYDLSATALTGGKVIAEGYLSVTNQATQSITLATDEIFKHQLERNSFTNTPFNFTIAVSGIANGDAVLTSLDWCET